MTNHAPGAGLTRNASPGSRWPAQKAELHRDSADSTSSLGTEVTNCPPAPHQAILIMSRIEHLTT
jgi:hypothetical protein